MSRYTKVHAKSDLPVMCKNCSNYGDEEICKECLKEYYEESKVKIHNDRRSES